jgi:hypothetical protein
MEPYIRPLMMGAAGAANPTYVEDVFSTYLYTGNGSTQTITNGIDLSGEGGLVWYKSRSNAVDNALFDTARGAGKLLISNTTDAEGAGYGQAFTSSGFSLTNGGTFYNGSGYTYASWTFREAPKFFDVVTFTSGTDTNRRISHSLGSVPGMIILKRTDGPQNWYIYHRSIGRNGYLIFRTDAVNTALTNAWGTSDPTSTDFGIDETTMLGAGNTYVAYLFAHDAGGFGDSGNESVIKCGTFTTGASGFSEVSLGWEPQWILVKKTNATQNWYLWDTMRGMAVTSSVSLSPNLSGAELDWGASSYIYPTANGFAGSGDFFGNGSTVIYIAIRRGPMKTPTDATQVFSAVAQSGDSAGYSTGFVIDAVWDFLRAGNSLNTAIIDRFRGTNTLSTSSTAAENAGFTLKWFDRNDGANPISLFGGGSSVGLLNFRRAPGFFDVVAYTGTGSATTVSHNLGVIPELIIVKQRSAVNPWRVYSAPTAATTHLALNTDAAITTSSANWNDTSPTSSVFTVGTGTGVNGSGGTYIAYLFATLSGVSKVGSYTGTGTTLQINCGFAAGARFVMIKRTDSTGDWYVWDTARGISSSNDPYLLLNSSAAEVTGTDYIDPLSSGFEISSSAPAAINASGGTYIYLSVA